jgi:hypothetical protein
MMTLRIETFYSFVELIKELDKRNLIAMNKTYLYR